MMNPRRREFLAFSRPAITEEAIQAVAAVLRSGWITTGRLTAEFEEAFRNWVGARESVALTSATAGMHLVLKALGIGPGDEVITPSITWVSTVNLITLAGATPVFADVDRDTLMVTPDSIRACLSPRTKCIVPVHFAGAACDLDGLRQLARDHEVRMIEDAAHALGTTYRGERIGQHGTAIFSFHPIKNMTTGEGGMVCTDDPVLAERVRRLKFHGLGADAYDRHQQGRAPQVEVLEPGYKYNLTDIAAALGLDQLRHLEEMNRRRRQWAQYYREHLADLEEILPLAVPAYPMEHAWHLFVVRLDTDRTGRSRDDFTAELKRRNIGTGLHFRAVHTQRFYRERPEFQARPLPHTVWNSERICSLPLFPGLEERDLEDVVGAIRDVLTS